jgi:hypothetical protein
MLRFIIQTVRSSRPTAFDRDLSKQLNGSVTWHASTFQKVRWRKNIGRPPRSIRFRVRPRISPAVVSALEGKSRILRVFIESILVAQFIRNRLQLRHPADKATAESKGTEIEWHRVVGAFRCSANRALPHATTYLPSRRATCCDLVRAVSAFDTDISPALSPFNPIFSSIWPRVRPLPSRMTFSNSSRFEPRRVPDARRVRDCWRPGPDLPSNTSNFPSISLTSASCRCSSCCWLKMASCCCSSASRCLVMNAWVSARMVL